MSIEIQLQVAKTKKKKRELICSWAWQIKVKSDFKCSGMQVLQYYHHRPLFSCSRPVILNHSASFPSAVEDLSLCNQ